jgi:hypothetical protein
MLLKQSHQGDSIITGSIIYPSYFGQREPAFAPVNTIRVYGTSNDEVFLYQSIESFSLPQFPYHYYEFFLYPYRGSTLLWSVHRK